MADKESKKKLHEENAKKAEEKTSAEKNKTSKKVEKTSEAKEKSENSSKKTSKKVEKKETNVSSKKSEKKPEVEEKKTSKKVEKTSEKKKKKQNSFLRILKEFRGEIIVGAIIVILIALILARGSGNENDVSENIPSDATSESVQFFYIKAPETCEYCDNGAIDYFQQANKQIFSQFDMTVEDEVYNFESSEAKEIIENYNIKTLPAVAMLVKEDNAAFNENPDLEKAFINAGESKYTLDDVYLSNGGQIDLYILDDDARAQFEEEKAQRAELMKEKLGYTQGEPQIDFFGMSFCPYGIQAENAIFPVYDSLGESVEYVPHYIMNKAASDNGRCRQIGASYYCALHGVPELDENIRQMCIYEDQKDKFIPYIKAIAAGYDAGEISSSNIESQWKSVAEVVGVDVSAVESCFNDENRVISMLDEEIELTNALGVSGSPTIYINGELNTGARTAENYKNALCSGFSQNAPDACSVVLSDEAGTASGSC